jgi:maleate isomerase
MAPRIRLGMLTPSSNTVLEPVTHAMLAGVPEVSVHFSRFHVTRIGLGEAADSQFEFEPMRSAARLLADARVQVIAWNGTSASWRGFDTDVRLCRDLTAETAVATATSVLALNRLFQGAGLRRLGLVTPYTVDVQSKIVANYRAAGIECVAERHLDISDNYAFAEVPSDTLDEMVRSVARARPDGIAVICTNLRAAPSVGSWESALGLPVYDSIAAVVWQSLGLAGIDPRRVRGWGRLFDTAFSA